jgi:type I restriction enzyme R subunit
MEYSPVRIEHETDTQDKLKRQWEINSQNITLNQIEFERILNHLNTVNIFERVKVLRDKFTLKRDNDYMFYIGF